MEKDRFSMMTEEQKKLAEDNINLVYSFIYKNNIPRDDIDEYFVYYCEAIILYDPNISAISTFIWLYLKNKYLRYRKQQIESVLLDEETTIDYFNKADSFSMEESFSFKEELKEFLDTIREKKKKIIFLLYLNGYNYAEIGKMMNHSRQNIQIIVSSILKKAQKFFIK